MPASDRLELDLKPATLDDVGIVADLEATRDPDDPRDPEMMRFWWTTGGSTRVDVRFVAVREGAALAFLGVNHEPWDEAPQRYGWIRAVIRPDLWTEPEFSRLIGDGEAWLRSEGAVTAVARAREDFKHEIEALDRIGYREERRQRFSELDLVEHRQDLLTTAAKERRRMQDQGLRLLTLSDDKDPDRVTKLHDMMVAAEQDIPSTVPIPKQPFDEWVRATFENPGVREDRFWIARDGNEIVGLSFLEFPPVRGLPWTAFTATSRSVRGRGIARGLKYQSVAQAVELGYKRVRTANDAANAPILHINQEMGYHLVAPLIEMHRRIDA